MGLRKPNRAEALGTSEVTFRRNETLMKVSGRLLKEYEKNPNPSLLLEAQKLLEFVIEDLEIRSKKQN